MSTLLSRRASQIVFFLLCVLVLTRMPVVSFAEESPCVSATIEDGVAVDAERTLPVDGTERLLAPIGFAPPIHTNPSLIRLTEYSILRL